VLRAQTSRSPALAFRGIPEGSRDSLGHEVPAALQPPYRPGAASRLPPESRRRRYCTPRDAVLPKPPNVSAHHWVSIFAALGQLLLAGLTLWRAGNSPLRVPLALLCVDIAAWTAGAFAFDMTQSPTAALVDHVLSPLTAPLALDFVLVFVGARRASHQTRIAAFSLAGSLSATTLVGVVAPRLHGFSGSRAWGIWLLATALPTMAVALVTLVRHLSATSESEERTRTSLLLFVFAIGTLFGVTEEVGHFAPTFPGLADIGMLICALGMALIALRFRLFGSKAAAPSVLQFGGAGVVSLYRCVLALHFAGPRATAMVLATSAIALAAFAVARDRIILAAQKAERTAQLATLGRFSAQMDHDVRNPLAALKGAAQLLQRDLANPLPAIDRVDFVDLMVAQCNRIEVIFDRFRRLSRLELLRSEVDVNALILSVLARQASAVPPDVVVRSNLANDLPSCDVDPDLLATVVENVARNAIEAMPAGGTLTIATSPTPRGIPGVVIAIQDTGVGMDARTAERATDDFFTTKPTGSGFGLAFARRVIEAHGGEIAIYSQTGKGTLVRMCMPLRGGTP
jgi:two-component system sensor histidine kinase HydH